MSEQVQAELLPDDEVIEDIVVDIQPLSIATPLEHFKSLFHRMADIRNKVILWESKTVIVSPKTRDEAIRLRTEVTKTAKLIQEARMNLVKPIQEYLAEVKSYADEACLPLAGTGPNDSTGVSGRLTKKINAYAEEQKRIEEETKRKALAALALKQAEIEAWELENKYREEQKRQEEDLRLQQIHEKALAEAQAKGHTETDEMQADLAMAEEQARIDAERAKRDEEAEQQRIQKEKELDEAQRKTYGEIARATTKVKGVKAVWSIELLEGQEDKLPRNVLTFDMSKARKWVDGGFHGTEKDPLKIIPGCRVVSVLGKGGK